MKIRDIVNETTSAGAVATVATPVGSMIRRNKPKKKKKKSPTESIEFQKLVDNFGMHEACKILEDYVINDDNLYESNSEQAIEEFEKLAGDEPQIGSKYYAVVLLMTNDIIRAADSSYGKLVKKTSDSYHIQTDSGIIKYPQPYLGKMLVKTLFFAEYADFTIMRTQLKLSHDANIQAVKERQ
jgi:hypothetical protein